MRKNPVLENEMKRYTRNMKCAWIILGVNLVLALFALIAQMGLSGRENYMTILQYRFPIQCYVLMGYGLFLAICILIPGLAGGAIAGERERKTLDLLLTTHLSPWKIILGKLESSLCLIFLISFSTLPVIGLVLIYGNYPGKSVPADPESCHHWYIYRKYRYLLFGDHAKNYGCGDFKLCDGGTSGARNGGYPVWNWLYSADAGNVPGRLYRHPAWRAGLSSVFQSGSHALWTDRTADNQRLRTGTAVWLFWRLQPFLWGGTYGRTVDSGTTGLFRSSPDRCRTAY